MDRGIKEFEFMAHQKFQGFFFFLNQECPDQPDGFLQLILQVFSCVCVKWDDPKNKSMLREIDPVTLSLVSPIEANRLQPWINFVELLQFDLVKRVIS